MTKRKAGIAAIVVVCGAVAFLFWYRNRPFPVVPPSATLYDGRYETGGYYQVTRFNDDGRHRMVVNLFSAVGDGKPGVYTRKFPHEVGILTSQYDKPLERLGPSRNPIEWLLRTLNRFRSRNKVAQWIAVSGDAIVTVHAPPAANGRNSISVELKDVVLRKEGSAKPNKGGAQQPDPDQCRIDSLVLGPVEFGT